MAVRQGGWVWGCGFCRGASCRVMALDALWRRELFGGLGWHTEAAPVLWKSLPLIGHRPDLSLSGCSHLIR